MRSWHLSALDVLDASLWNLLWLRFLFFKYLNTLSLQMGVLLRSQETVPFLCTVSVPCAKVNSLPSKSLRDSSVVSEGWVAAGKGCHDLGFGAHSKTRCI